ncbi:MAG TPA: replication-associated recombination protein A [Myxococcota bacterium]|nr:replication-associated recombination protein A [Myxococcota bacterium]
MRPRTLDEIAGHARWFGPGTPLRRSLDQRRLASLLLWGPPGCGKTTLARALARHVGAPLHVLSAVHDGIKALRELLSPAPLLGGHPPVVLVDEIHRWSKAQQDALLPHLESGALVLLGATTENPGFSVVPALRSRARVLRLDPLGADDVYALLQRALASPEGLDRADLRADDVLRAIADGVAGDARRALTELEQLVESLPPEAPLDLDWLARAPARVLRHDRAGDDHHDVVSALIKSMRGSDPDAAIYWLARMIAAGEDPTYIARRLMIFASEDVGNADPRALAVATDACFAVERVGMPEGRIPLAQAVTWLACCPKSDAAYRAIDEALAEVERTGALPVPEHLRSAPVRGDAPYRNPHEHPHHLVRQEHRPPGLTDRTFYRPADHGEEKTIRARLQWWRERLR